ncbi:DUF1851 domain-containing protein [Nocardioides agariphilus]|uniref:DUF1851 domain-containing protein n=1 Tax=Nocardioides agariphilus TaxID=433664 RepID=A0A930VML8_9ACTN|nr:T6SS immunity protein Tdi1 domain-containing protein [Nocardioides agariphilus]MBF4766630.1 DUF1851 domain-containing protein [Nocardioides agariphilus]
MFERFWAAYSGLRDTSEAGSVWTHQRLKALDGYIAFAREFAGASFDGGVYRVHDDRTGPQALSLVTDAFPEFAERVCPFGYDWLGRQFAVDSGRVVGQEPQVLLLEPGTGEALEIPFSFAAFHDVELVDHSDAALASAFFADWSRSNTDQLPLRRDECVGYRIPLFLGGDDTLVNLEVSDIDVYWTLCGQLRGQTF